MREKALHDLYLKFHVKYLYTAYGFSFSNKMVINQAIVKAINKQINNEFTAAYNYLAMASYFASANLNGFCQWMKFQAKEEIEHGMKLVDYLQDRNTEVELLDIKTPKQKWNTPLNVFEDVYAMEVTQTAAIHALVRLADDKQEYTTRSILNWFLEEQIDEESNALRILDKLRLVGKEPAGLLFIDKEMSGRMQ